MAESRQETNRKSTTIFIIATVVVFIILAAIIVFRGCHQSNLGEDQVRPGDPLPGAQDATGYLAPDAVPLLRAT